MRDLVLGWWLTFTQAGLSSARIDKLAWRTEEWQLQQLQEVKNEKILSPYVKSTLMTP
jgi:hypothetical protein